MVSPGRRGKPVLLNLAVLGVSLAGACKQRCMCQLE